MSCSPRLDAFRIFVLTWNKLVECLNDKINLHLAFQFWEEFFFYCFQDLFPYNEDNFGKSRPYRIEQRVVHDRFPVRAKTIDLFYSAITATDAGSQHKKRKFFLNVAWSVHLSLVI